MSEGCSKVRGYSVRVKCSYGNLPRPGNMLAAVHASIVSVGIVFFAVSLPIMVTVHGHLTPYCFCSGCFVPAVCTTCRYGPQVYIARWSGWRWGIFGRIDPQYAHLPDRRYYACSSSRTPLSQNARSTLLESVRLLYQGMLRTLLVLLHDFPEFLSDYHLSFCDVIPPSCIQLRNLVLAAFPRSMRLPDPFTPNLKVRCSRVFFCCGLSGGLVYFSSLLRRKSDGGCNLALGLSFFTKS